MRRMLACLLAIFLAATQPAFSSPGDAPSREGVFPFPVHRTELPNGLNVLSVEYDSPGIIAYYTVVRTGSRNEVEPGLSGFAHFFEHMMFRGTPRFSEGKYTAALKALGADSNAFTTDDWTCYHITASAAALETIVDIESDRFQNLKYDEPAFQKEARAVLGEYNKSASSPFLLLDEKMQDTAFTSHTYKHTTIGLLKDIEDMPNQYAYSLTFFDRWYRPENCVVLVVGDVKHERLVELAKKYYGGWKQGGAKIDIPIEPPQRQEKKLTLEWKGETLPYIYVGYHVPGFDASSRDIAALDLLAQAVFSDTSPLYRQLVLQERKVELLSGSAPFRRDPTLFTVMVRLTDEKHIDSVRDAIYAALEHAAAEKIDSRRLADIKSHLRYSFVMGLDTPDATAHALGEFLELTGNPDSVNEMYATYDRVTAEDIQRVAAKYFVPTNRTCITLTATKRTAAGGACGGAARPEAESTGHLQDAAQPEIESTRQLQQVARPASPPLPLGEGRGEGSHRPPHSPSEKLHTSLRQLLAPTLPCSPDSVAPLDNQPFRIKPTVLPSPRSPLVALRVQFRVGSMDDPVGKEGLAALTARLIAEGGSKSLSYEEILERLYPMAADISARPDREVTTFIGNVHRDKLDEFYALFSEMILSPRFDHGDFERLREEQLNYVSKILRGNDDESLGKWTLQLALYPRRPFGHVDAGTVAGLKAITLDDVKEFYATRYVRSAVHLGLAGGMDQVFVERYQADFARLPNKPLTRPNQPRPHEPSGLELTIVEKDSIATAISIGYPLKDLNRRDDDFYALAVANSALGEHRTFNGRLMINMRGKRGLNYGDYSYIENFIQHGGSTFPVPNIPRQQQYFSIWIRPVPHDKAVFALRQAVRELDMLVEHGLSQEEFEATRNFLLNYSKLWVQTLSRRLGYEMDGAFYGRDSIVAELDRRLPKLTRDEVNAAIRKHLQARHVAVAVVTRDAAAFRDTVLSGEPSPLRYDTAGTPTEILDEDKLIEVYPLRINRERLRIVPASAMFENVGGD